MTNSLSVGLAQFVSRLPGVFRQAGTSGGLALHEDAVHEEPTPPLDTGHLRGSGFVRVDGQLVHGSGPAGAAESGKLRIDVGFATPYARYQHEGLEPGPGVTHPTSGKHVQLQPGPKSQQVGDVGGLFLSLKLDRNRQRYARIIAARLNRAFGSGS